MCIVCQQLCLCVYESLRTFRNPHLSLTRALSLALSLSRSAFARLMYTGDMQNIVNTLRSEMADKQREIENAREELQRLGDQV